MDRITEVLEKAKVIAVVGMSDRPFRDSYRIGEFLINQGYTVYPVNPQISSVLGLKAYPTLQSVPEKIDIVDVFRSPEHALQTAKDAIAVKAKAIWFQLGTEEEDAEILARDAGLDVISGQCIAVEHRRRQIGRRNVARTDNNTMRSWRNAAI